MGDMVKQDRALSLPILHKIVGDIELEWQLGNKDEKEYLALEASFYLIAFCGGLRGEEVPLCDLTGIRKWWNDGDVPGVTPHVTIAFSKRFHLSSQVIFISGQHRTFKKRYVYV
jgi:hypothetical protein